LAQARVICDATDLPVSADLEKGFGDAPDIVAETIRLAAEAGLVGCSIEDASGNQDAPIFELGHATERIAAAAAAARALPFPFTLTGRTENFLRGRLDLDDRHETRDPRCNGLPGGALAPPHSRHRRTASAMAWSLQSSGAR
jgi:2-methylisocitrate lyase-like PEP mutase family enzyme